MSVSSHSGSSGDDILIRRLLDGLVTEDEFQQIQTRIESDSAFRKRYVELVDLEAGLYEELSVPESESKSVLQDVPASKSVTIRRLAAILAVGVACAIAFLALTTLSVKQADPDKDLASVPETPKPVVVFVPAKIEETPDAAILTRVEGVDVEGLTVGRRFKSGTLKIPSGKIQLEFLSGARVAVAGPAQLQILSKDAATLLSGQATANVPDYARGFVLNSPGAAVVDLGTKFGVRVNAAGESEVEVIEGKVEVSVLGDDGNTLVSRELDKDETVRVVGGGIELVGEGTARESLPEITELDDSPAPITDSYIRAVLDSEPSVYWRFEVEEESQIRNEVGSEWWADVIRGEDKPECLQLINGHARFDGSAKPRCVKTNEPVLGLNEGPFTLEVWLKPENLRHMTCVSTATFEDEAPYKHLNVIEIASESHLIHDPGALRFLHRHPPSHLYETGTNLFANGRLGPGQWQHVVAVKGEDSLELYFNGELARQIFASELDGAGDYRIFLGQLRMTTAERQYVGGMDEFALYKRALTAEEIHEHFRLAQQPNAEN